MIGHVQRTMLSTLSVWNSIEVLLCPCFPLFFSRLVTSVINQAGSAKE